MKILVKSLVLVLMIFTLVACGNGDDGENDEDVMEISLSTASSTGTYYPLGANFASVMNNNLDNVNVSSLESEGSVQNLNLMAEGEVNSAFTSVGPLYAAYNGINEFDGRPYEDVRVIMALYPNASHILVPENSDLTSILDFAGVSFAAGAPGSVTQEISQWLLEANEMSFDDLSTEYVDFTESVNLLRNNQVDVIHYSTALGTAGIIEAMTTANAKLFNIDEETIESIETDFPAYYRYEIEAGTYEGQEEPVITLAQNGVYVVTADMPDDIVYDMTKALWENMEGVREGIAAAEFIQLENAIDGLADVPLHPGAERYYQEEGLLD